MFDLILGYLFGNFQKILFNKASSGVDGALEMGIWQYVSRSRCFVYTLFFFLFICPIENRLYAANSESQTISKRYLMADGLSSNRIYSIVQDSLGFIWFGTNDGLNRFDGINFKKYYYKNGDSNSISSNSIRWLLISRDNKMWISLDNGIDIYNPYTNSFSKFNVATSTGEVINNRVLEMMEDRDGDIWIGTLDNGLYRYSPAKNELKVYRTTSKKGNAIPQNWITTLFEDGDGIIWIGTYSEGLCSFSKKTDQFTTYKKTGDRKGPSDNSIRKIFEDSFGYFWIGTFQNGLDRFDKKTGDFVNYRNDAPDNLLYHIHDIIEYRKGELLITSDNGVAIFNIVEGDIKYNKIYNREICPFASKFIYKAYKDIEGSLWLGSYHQGVEYFPPIQNNFHYYSCPVQGNQNMGKVIKTVCEDKNGKFWIGTDDDGIYTYNAVTGEIKPFRTAKDINSTFYCITDFLLDDDKLYVGTYERGLEVFDLKNKSVRSYLYDSNNDKSIPSSRAFSLFKSSNGRIYIGTGNGLCYYNRENDNFVRLGPSLRITSIAEDKHNNLWVATISNGLFYYNIKTNEYKSYSFDINDKSSLIRNVISTLTYDSNGNLWVGSDGYGLCRYDDSTDTFVRYDDLKLPNNIISDIISDGTSLWISTNKGLVKWDPTTNSTKTYSRSHGLYNEQFMQNSGLYCSNGQIILGSTDGFCVFSPHKLVENQYNPPVVITNLSINNKEVGPLTKNSPLTHSIETTKNIILAYDQSTIGFEFASLSYMDPQDNQYQYMLEGFDKEWLTTNGQSRFISYTNLPSGKYILRIRGTNSDKIWSTNEIVLNITVKPHFLKSHAAIILYIFCFLLLVSFLIWYLQRSSEKKHNEKIKLIESKSQKEVYDSKIEFFTNIAHEIRTPLSLIVGPLEYVIKKHNKNDQYAEFLSIIEQNYKRLYALVSQLLDFRKVDSGNYKVRYELCNLSELITDVVSLFKVTAQQNDIQINISIQPSDLQLIVDREALTKIITNLISNAIKYTDKHILISAYQHNNENYIEVEDDGPGISVEERENIFEAFYQINNQQPSMNKGVGVGLHMTRSLVLLMGGTINVSDSERYANSVKFIIKLPNQNQTELHHPTKVSLDDIIINDFNLPYSEDIEDMKEETSIKSYSVMIVDDNPEILDFLSKILKQDYFIIAASSGEEALQILKKNQVDLIVSDIMMGEMDGLDLCHHIKSDINTSHIPVILLTAKTDTETKIKGLDCGADAYIEKPFSPFHLRAQLRNLIKTRDELKQRFASTPLSEVSITTHNKLDEEFVEKCTSIILDNISSADFSIDSLAKEMGLSRTSIFVKLKAISNMTPNDFIKVIRLKTACKMMTEGKYRVTEIGFLVGFNSSSYFAKCFSKQFGMLPTEYMKNIEGNS